MISQQLDSYLKELIPSRKAEVEQIEAYAAEHEIPIMELVGMECFLQQLKLIKPQRILEIGAAIGYSAIRMAEATGATVVTIERDQVRYEQAIENIQKLNLANRIHVHFGDALELSQRLESDPLYDVLFIDAAKGQYQRFFDLYSPFVKKGGVIFSDNVLFRGFVAEEDIDNKRLQKLAQKIKRYNQWLMSHPGYETMILPVGDGLAVSIKK